MCSSDLSVLTGELLALPGWAGTFRQLEVNPGLAPYHQVPCSLMEFLAVRLTLKSAAAWGVARRLRMGADGIRRARSGQAPQGTHPTQLRANALALMDALSKLGLSERDIRDWNPTLQRRLVSEIQAFHPLERRRLLHLAYERRHEDDVLQIGRAHV